MDDEKASLNYDCNYNLFLAKRLIRDIVRVQDRQNAVKWLRFLMASNKTVSEMQLRNDFMYYLVLNLQEGSLRPPFNSPPPISAGLTDIAGLIPSKIDNTETADDVTSTLDAPTSEKPMVMSKSPDGGAFLAVQPVPHQGSFCYLAITTKKDGNN
ncbi:uncharacterized protein LOC107271750 [Cephus cinctus]|uniref:Uncharacterized protein LOC107271750 n=1 Tax=Cephus cinctus TaxID=211228 RepID=A0AAJ7W517_CEPCN|nr:uncharacterized protein LOC107271750 [Cephus cinctus]